MFRDPTLDYTLSTLLELFMVFLIFDVIIIVFQQQKSGDSCGNYKFLLSYYL